MQSTYKRCRYVTTNKKRQRKDKKTMSDINPPSGTTRMNIRGFLPSIIINGAIPLAIYLILKHYNYSELVALSASVLFPVIGSVISIVRQRTLDLIAALALLGIAISIIAVFLGGDPKLLLIRESFLTGALGVACFVSLLLPRPLMFYFGRYFATGNNPARRVQYNRLWQYPRFRFVNRIITIVWGVAYIGEFILRAIMAYTLPIPIVLAISPFILGGITIVTIVWTIAYARRSWAKEERSTEEQPTEEGTEDDASVPTPLHTAPAPTDLSSGRTE